MVGQSKWHDGYWDGLDIQLYAPHHSNSDCTFTSMISFGPGAVKFAWRGAVLKLNLCLSFMFSALHAIPFYTPSILVGHSRTLHANSSATNHSDSLLHLLLPKTSKREIPLAATSTKER
ncbi:hypothetical protein AVEN_12309-1 [Araneus ventricosus]|uniref:Uncharacterized protein n=1 Tax=Araneus ventricosus TaxID=182803 RepID=A0A4Y2E8C7_ARAVE|nr:hypothetical protein AVEN_12309-1 [Araneus ventricosus]